MSKPPDENARIQNAKRELERAGFEVKPRLNWIKHSFQVEEKRLKQLQAAVERRKVFMKDALDEALADWIKKEPG